MAGLYGFENDGYAVELERQNSGSPCSKCFSPFGHYRMCPLINREVAEAQSATLNKPDADFLKALKIRW